MSNLTRRIGTASTAVTVLGILGIAALGIVGGINEAEERRVKRDEVYPEFSKAVGGYDGSTTSSDWEGAYAEHGKQYDVHAADPLRDFSSQEMRAYVENHFPKG